MSTTSLYIMLGVDFLVDLWWFRSLGYEWYFWQRLVYRYVVFAVFTLGFFLVFFLNFWVASRFLGSTSSPQTADEPEKKRRRRLLRQFRQGSLRVYLPFSLFLGLLVAYPLYREWETTLLFLFGGRANVADPAFGVDISYYFFRLPIYRLLVRELAIALTLLFLGLALLYWLEKRLLAKEELSLPRGARIHLSVILVGLAAVGFKYLLYQRHLLLFTTAHTPLFFGPGFVERWVILPIIWLMLVFLAGLTFSLVGYLLTGRYLRGVVVFGLLLILSGAARYSQALPELTQKYLVKPDEISRERPYLIWNIQATLAAYGLNQVETREYRSKAHSQERGEALEFPGLWRNIPVWDKDMLGPVYKELQGLRPYYDFAKVDVDRYSLGGSRQQVFLAARELNLQKLPAAAQNWVNKRLKYTHGYGAVMTPAAQGGDEPMVWFLEDLPPRSDYGLELLQPAIYYGLGSYEPAIAPNDSREVGYPTAEGHTLTDYQGKGGIPVNSLFRKLIFAMYFKEKDIFFTTKTNPQSRLLFRRHIVERIKYLTPALKLDRDPYIVVTPQGLFWLQDAYTTSPYYPCAQPSEEGFNYIRNAVKIVVDAYNGSVDYYVADPADPIIRAWQRIYPGLFKDLQQMPQVLQDHLRYPKDLFDIQMNIYVRYHQTDPEIFYKQEDLWEWPEIQQGEARVRMDSYYLTLNFFDYRKAEFILLTPMVPKGRANLRALVGVGCDPPNYGKIMVYSFPKGALVYGPSQVNAIIDQDTVISQQFSLWNQLGSQVERGRLLVVPIEGGVYYIQSVFLKAAGQLQIPQLKRLIISRGELVVMEASLEEGFAKLSQKIQVDTERLKRRLEGFRGGEVKREPGAVEREP